MTPPVVLPILFATACIGLLAASPPRAEGFGFEAGQFEINVMQGAEKIGTSFTMTAEGRACGEGIRCNWDLDGAVTMWADTMEGKRSVVSAGVGMSTDRRGYSASVSPRVFRDGCGALLSAADPKLPPARVRQIITLATDLFRSKSRQRVQEGRLVVIGQRHTPGVKTNPDDAYYRCIVEELEG